MGKDSWKELAFKDKAQYVMAITLLCSGIIIAFLSFCLIKTIASGTLIYIAQAFTAGGSIFGVSIYFNSKLGEFKSSTTEEIRKIIQEVIEKK